MQKSTLKKIPVAKKELLVLGIDPGIATIGWSVIKEENGSMVPLAFGHISTAAQEASEKRLLEISLDLEKIIQKYSPEEAAVEKLFFFKNQKTVIGVAEARGAILLTLARNNVKVCGYTPLQVKQALTGYGRAEKKQVQLIIKNILRLKRTPRPDDTADAIAIAVCHLNSRRWKNLIS